MNENRTAIDLHDDDEVVHVVIPDEPELGLDEGCARDSGCFNP